MGDVAWAEPDGDTLILGHVGTLGMNPAMFAKLPDVPTVAEHGYPCFETSQWYGIIAPVKTPDAIVKKLAADIAAAVKSPEVLARFQGDGTLAVGNTPAEFAEFIRKEQERWGDVVRRSGVKAE